MISFKQYLTEARMAPLYHYSSGNAATLVISQNILRAGNNEWNETNERYGKPTAFFTRSYKNAVKFASFRGNDGVIFEVDQLKLSHRYKITPVHNWHKSYYGLNKKETHKASLGDGIYGTEFEEVVDKDIKDFMSYVTTIHFLPKFATDENHIKNFYPTKVTDVLAKYPGIEYKKVVK